MTDTDKTPRAIDPTALAALGEGQVAYVKPMRSDEVRRLFPQAQKACSPGSTCSPCCRRAERRSW